MLAGAVHAYGAAIVFEVGEPVLGYPPTWCHQVGEANKVLKALHQDPRIIAIHQELGIKPAKYD